MNGFIGTKLRQLLENKNLTQKKLAQELNLSPSTLNGYIQNKRQPDGKTVITIAAYFDVTTDELYGVDQVKESSTLSYNSKEIQLISIYRKIPEEMQSLYLETGVTFSDMKKKKKKKKK